MGSFALDSKYVVGFRWQGSYITIYLRYVYIELAQESTLLLELLEAFTIRIKFYIMWFDKLNDYIGYHILGSLGSN
jgi:hypothetical protein